MKFLMLEGFRSFLDLEGADIRPQKGLGKSLMILHIWEILLHSKYGVQNIKLIMFVFSNVYKKGSNDYFTSLDGIYI